MPTEEEIEQEEQELDNDDDGPGDGVTGLAAMEKALGEAKGKDDDEEEEDDDEEEPAAKAAGKSPKRTTLDALKNKRKENKRLRDELGRLRGEAEQLRASGGKGAAEAQALLELARTQPYTFLRKAGADVSALHDQMNKDALGKGGLSPEIREFIEGQTSTIKELNGKIEALQQRLDQAGQNAAANEAISAFKKEVSDLTRYPEFEGYTVDDLIRGAAQVVEQLHQKGVKSATPEFVAKRLHEILAEEHKRIFSRKAKAKPAAAPKKPEPPELPRVKPSKKKAKLPSEDEVIRRMTGAMKEAGLISPC